jgi:hypothetical protein
MAAMALRGYFRKRAHALTELIVAAGGLDTAAGI